MERARRGRGRPPKIGDKASVRVVFQLYPKEAETFYDWAERQQVSQVDAFRRLLTLVAQREETKEAIPA